MPSTYMTYAQTHQPLSNIIGCKMVMYIDVKNSTISCNRLLIRFPGQVCPTRQLSCVSPLPTTNPALLETRFENALIKKDLRAHSPHIATAVNAGSRIPHTTSEVRPNPTPPSPVHHQKQLAYIGTQIDNHDIPTQYFANTTKNNVVIPHFRYYTQTNGPCRTNKDFGFGGEVQCVQW